jgi:putative ABC transport system ATP-binding protein
MADIVSVSDLHRTYRFGGVHALQGVNLKVRIGEFVVIKGRSGSGKTTLLNIIGGLDDDYRGLVSFNGNSLAEMSEDDKLLLRRTKIGFVFQSFGLLPHFSALETVDFALRLSGYTRQQRKESSIKCLSLVGLENKTNHRPDELSGGEQQRLCIARAIAFQPSLILADEPTGELDSSTGREILSLFRQILSTGDVSIILASHDPMVDDFATVVYEISDGQISKL